MPPARQQPRQQPTVPQRGAAVEETALATRTTTSGELAPTAAAAQQQYEIQSAIVLARQFPRDEMEAYQRLMRSCARSSFAQDAEYTFPRGGQDITGPSVNLAREAARLWGNVRYGVDVLRDDGLTRQIRGWAWDLETNVKVTAEDDFRKEVQRKRDGRTQWVPADERDLRELTFRRGAILIRNCILQLLPPDFIEDATQKCRGTLKSEAAQDPDGARKWVVKAFDTLNVSVKQLEEYLETPLAKGSAEQIAKLKTIYRSIADGNSTWAEYAPKPTAAQEPGGAGGGRMDRLAGVEKADDFAAEAAEKEAAEAEAAG
jgi:hypothetical protein